MSARVRRACTDVRFVSRAWKALGEASAPMGTEASPSAALPSWKLRTRLRVMRTWLGVGVGVGVEGGG